jgi:hypothetical protein
MSIREYLALVRSAHQEQGALSGQRDVLTTTTARRIRDRMISDLRQGAVLPPVVLGCVVDGKRFNAFPLPRAKSVEDFLPPPAKRKVSIIDGMQRTGAIIAATEVDSGMNDRMLRVEFWLATSVRSMIYRMLVLNTSQVPWTISRQLSVVYANLLDEIKAKVPDIEKVFSPDKAGRRVAAAQFASDALVELYIAFSLRKTSVDTKEAISEEFSRLDFVENLAESEFQDQFYSVLGVLARLDKAFSEYDSGTGGRFSKGRNVFDAQPARIGFVVAAGLYVLGRPGMSRGARERSTKLKQLSSMADALVTKLNKMSPQKLGDFLKLDVLEETLDKRVGQVGRYERSVYFEAFKVLIEEEFKLPDLEACWRAN